MYVQFRVTQWDSQTGRFDARPRCTPPIPHPRMTVAASSWCHRCSLPADARDSWHSAGPVGSSMPAGWHTSCAPGGRSDDWMPGFLTSHHGRRSPPEAGGPFEARLPLYIRPTWHYAGAAWPRQSGATMPPTPASAPRWLRGALVCLPPCQTSSRRQRSTPSRPSCSAFISAGLPFTW